MAKEHMSTATQVQGTDAEHQKQARSYSYDRSSPELLKRDISEGPTAQGTANARGTVAYTYHSLLCVRCARRFASSLAGAVQRRSRCTKAPTLSAWRPAFWQMASKSITGAKGKR
jgi:hypothetical protein